MATRHTVVNVTADANGGISNSGFQTNNGDKHEAFLVKAVGATSKRTAYTKFTDLGATITLNPGPFNETPSPVTVQIFGSGFSLGSNQVCFYQSSTNALIYCTGYGVSASEHRFGWRSGCRRQSPSDVGARLL